MVERKVDGSIIKPLRKSISIYFKRWMIVDLMSMTGMCMSFRHRQVFIGFVDAVTKNNVKSEMKYVKEIKSIFEHDPIYIMLMIPKAFQLEKIYNFFSLIHRHFQQKEERHYPLRGTFLALNTFFWIMTYQLIAIHCFTCVYIIISTHV